MNRFKSTDLTDRAAERVSTRQIIRLNNGIRQACRGLCVASFFASSALIAQTSFSPKTDFGTGSGPFSIVLEDLNKDGKLDLAIANNIGNSVSILFNSSAPLTLTPSFSVKTDFAAGSSPRSISVGDMNGDGKPDLIVTNIGDQTMSVFLSTTDSGASVPTYGAKEDITTGNGPASVSISDLNADGKLDVAVANSDDQTVSIFFNTTDSGASTFSCSPRTDFAVGNSPTSVAIGDLNGDGKPDLAIANNYDSTVSVLLNMTSAGASLPSYSSKTDFSTGTGPFSVSIGDVNGDGKPDLAVANNNNYSVSVLLNTTDSGASTPSYSGKTDFTTGLSPRSVSLSDLNGDGRLDIAVANLGDHTVSVLINTTAALASVPSYSAKTDYTAGDGQREVSIGDLNGDGKADMATVNYFENSVSVFMNTSSAPLPVELVSFTAAAKSGGVRLEWHTATETDNYGFEVEKSVTHQSSKSLVWNTIGFLEGSGTSNSPTVYGYTDNYSPAIPSEMISYRLKQIDQDGKSKYSKTIEVYLYNPSSKSGLRQNYPNPFNPTTAIHYRLSAAGHVTVTAFDILGKEVAQLVNERAEAGEYAVQFDASALPSGIYFYTLRTDAVVETKKMILLK